MEVVILTAFSSTFLKEQIDSYHSTGWRMDGDVVVTYCGREVEGDLIVMYAQKMVRGNY